MLAAVWTYIERKDSVKPIVFLRIALSVFAGSKIAVLYACLNDIYGQYGYVQWAVSKAGLYDFLPHIGDYYAAYGALLPPSSELLPVLFWLYMASLLCLACGLFTRLVACLCFYFHLLWIDTGSGLMYGVDVFTQMAFFYLLFMPAGRWCSLDVALGLVTEKKVLISAGVTRKLVQMQLLLVYTSSGIEKGLGTQWWNGEAMWRSLMLPSFAQYDMAWLAHYPGLLMGAGWLVVLLETFYPLLLLLPRVRVGGLLGVCLLHLSIGLFLGMWLFAAIMIILSLFAFGPEALSDVRKYRAKKKTGQPRFLLNRQGQLTAAVS